MLKLVISKRSNVDIHSREVVDAVAAAIAKTRVNTKPSECVNDARTVISAWVLGQNVEVAAQRLLTWWCIDWQMSIMNLYETNQATQDRVLSSAKAGYDTLRGFGKEKKLSARKTKTNTRRNTSTSV